MGKATCMIGGEKMKVSELVQQLELKTLAGENSLNNEVLGCCICDLLSYVMSRATKGDVWITVQTNINVVAVAVLTEVACVIVPENIEVDAIMLKKAEMEEIPILSSRLSAYELACRLYKLRLNDSVV